MNHKKVGTKSRRFKTNHTPKNSVLHVKTENSLLQESLKSDGACRLYTHTHTIPFIVH
jgi:hypothetical protein